MPSKSLANKPTTAPTAHHTAANADDHTASISVKKGLYITLAGLGAVGVTGLAGYNIALRSIGDAFDKCTTWINDQQNSSPRAQVTGFQFFYDEITDILGKPTRPLTTVSPPPATGAADGLGGAGKGNN